MAAEPIATWHRAVKTRDSSLLPGILAEDVVFYSPVVHTPQIGRNITIKYLAAALHVLVGPTWRYVGECTSGRMAALEFETELDGIVINGVDLIRWNNVDLITEFKVMVRPLQAVNHLHQLMGRQLMRSSG